MRRAISGGAEGESQPEVLMAKDKFAIGIDYGTESGRAVVVRVRDGQQMGAAVVPYPDGVIDEKLPSGPHLEHDWAG